MEDEASSSSFVNILSEWGEPDQDITDLLNLSHDAIYTTMKT